MQSLFKSYSQALYVAILAFCSATIVWGNFLITLASILLISFWILNGNYKQRVSTLLSNKAAICYLIIIAMILLRCLVQFPHQAAIRACTKYLPFLLFIFTLGSYKELTHKQFKAIILIFICSLDINTIVCVVQQFFNQTDTSNFRAVGKYMSYIRLSLFTVVACAACAHYLFYDKNSDVSKIERIFLWVSVIWLTFVVVFLKTLMGYIIYALLATIFAISQIKQNYSSKVTIIIFAVFTALFVAVGAVLYSEARYFIFSDTINPETLDTHTQRGNAYSPYKQGTQAENGHWANMYVCPHELDSCWQARTGIGSIWTIGKNGFSYFPVICRYMASKNLRKDADGFAQLTDTDIENIKNGFTNYRFTSNSDIRKRIYEAFWEIHSYHNGDNPNGHSITQRLQFLATAKKVADTYPWIGAGAFAQTEMFKFYERDNVLQQTNWNLPHNQFMLMLVTTGYLGLTIFVLCFIGIVVFSRKKWNALTISWFVATIVSFLSEDTMNTLAGTAFCAFLGGIILFAQPNIQSK